MTSKSRPHAVLFTKENCGPCFKTKVFLHDLFEASPALYEVISILAKENHSALVEAYDLSLYPTLLITGDGGKEVRRYVGGKLIRDVIEQELTEILEVRRG